jgi:hypothetical protein
MRWILGASATLGLLAISAACSTTVNPSSNATPDGGTSVPTGDAGPGSDAGACTKTPPTGAITVAAAEPDQSKHAGQESALALDGDGYPLIAFSSASSTGQLFFTKWDPCAGAFTTPIVVDDVGQNSSTPSEVNENGTAREVSIARDPASGTIAIAYAKALPDEANPIQAVYIAKSTDGGATWAKEQLSVHPADDAGDIHEAVSPAIGFAEGKWWVAYAQTYVYCDGAFGDDGQPRCEGWLVSGDTGNWQRQVIPRSPNGKLAVLPQIGIATDSAGKIGLAYVTGPDTGYNRYVMFWRPGSNPVPVFDSADEQNDDPSVSLAFFGTKPRVVAHLVQAASTDYDMLFSQSDDGLTWSPAVHVARDATRVTAFYQSMTIDSKGNIAIAADDNGGTDATPKCGDPKIARSTNGTDWDTCGADPTPGESGTNGDYVSMKYGPDDKLQLVFFNGDTDPKYPNGVLYWHE